MVFAGAAAHAYGCSRLVTDLDIIVREQDHQKAMQLLEDIEDLDILGMMDMPFGHGSYLFYADDEMIGKAQHRPLLGLTIPVIPVEDNILLKAILQRGEDQEKRDILDIECMIENQTIDLDYLKRRMRLYKAEERVIPLLSSLLPNL